jgi:hypothetical protein
MRQVSGDLTLDTPAAAELVRQMDTIAPDRASLADRLGLARFAAAYGAYPFANISGLRG